MKITEHCTSIDRPFAELEVGDVFRDQDGNIMMKISPATYGDTTNCVNLKSGEGCPFCGWICVALITDVELIIR